MQLKNSTTWGRPILVTFDGGVWYWDRLFLRIVFVPHGRKRNNWWYPPIEEVIKFNRNNNYKGAVKLALKSELRRINGEYAYESDLEARQKFFEALRVPLSEVPNADVSTNNG